MTATIEIECTTGDVATILRARTKTSTGEEAGDFGEDTRPTGDEVETLIARATASTLAKTGAVPADLVDAAKAVVALRAAMLVELTMFPEQVRSERSAFPEYKTMHDEDVAALLSAMTSSPAGQGPGVYSVMSRTPRTMTSDDPY
jgi:hypothetical protein